MKKITTSILACTFLICLGTIQAQYNPDINIDGNYCNHVPSGDPGPDEWTNAGIADPVDGASSCEMNTLYFDLIDIAGDDYLAIAVEKGNQGKAYFRFFANTDCDNTTGYTGIPSNNFTQAVAGAEAVVDIIVGNGSIAIARVGNWDGTNFVFSGGAGLTFLAAQGVSDGCNGSNQNFFEVALLITDFIDVCDPSVNCGSVEFVSAYSHSGGSVNSSECDEFAFSVTTYINSPPDPNFTADDIAVCTADLPVINLDASGTVDSNVGNVGPEGFNDDMDWKWSTDNSGTFGLLSGTSALTGASMSTTYTPTVGGIHNVVLTVTDNEGCEIAADTIQIVVSAQPTITCAAITPTRDCDVSTDVNYDASSAIDNTPGANLTFLWEFGDGSTSSTPSGVYSPGNCLGLSAKVTITDPDSDSPCDTVVCSWNLLPIELAEFTAKSTSQSEVTIEWVTLSEDNNDYFTIERSSNGNKWNPIGTIEGQGTTSTRSHYNFIDKNPLPGTSFYRLVQTDFDGTYSFSDVVSLNRIVDDALISKIYPNPSTGTINWFTSLGPDQMVEFCIKDVQGKVVAQNTMNATHRMSANMDQLTDGVYFVYLNSETFSKAQKVVLSRGR